MINKATEDHNDVSKIIYLKVPYHIRCQQYCKKRNEIFNESEISLLQKKTPKRSTIRYRFLRMKKLCSKLLVSTIVSNPKDLRYYAKMSFLDCEVYGLIDTDAIVSCIGSDLAAKDYNKFPSFIKVNSTVKTADGSAQKVLGWIEVNLLFKGQSKLIKFL